MERNIKNANGKVIGHVSIEAAQILVVNNNKPVVQMTIPDYIKRILEKDICFIVELYDDYTLTIAEIAALYDESYARMAHIIKALPTVTGTKAGRRNSSYSLTFSPERRRHISVAQIGRPRPSTYIRTPEIREKISTTLKDGYKSGRIVQDPALKSKAWAEGKYANAKMGRGIQGYFHSIKMDKDMYFRSLMELKYLLLLESRADVKTYVTEPFQIRLPHGAHYTPDVLLNDEIIVELKPKTFYRYTDMHRFCIEMAGLNDYCKTHKKGFVVVYDTDIDFDSKKFRRYIKNHPDIIKQYDIRFTKDI